MNKFLKIISLCLISNAVSALELNAEELAYFKRFFNSVQPQSFAQNREFCGYIGYDSNDQFIATEPTRGEQDSCLPAEPPANFDLIGSYHTHGAFSPDADSELPSYADMAADIQEEVDGFIATPGGRIWHVDTVDGISRMVCGRDCVLSDPNFDADLLYRVEKTYTLQQLKARDEIDN